MKTLHPNVNKNVLKEVKTIHTFNLPYDGHLVENGVAIKGIRKSKTEQRRQVYIGSIKMLKLNTLQSACAHSKLVVNEIALDLFPNIDQEKQGSIGGDGPKGSPKPGEKKKRSWTV